MESGPEIGSLLYGSVPAMTTRAEDRDGIGKGGVPWAIRNEASRLSAVNTLPCIGYHRHVGVH